MGNLPPILLPLLLLSLNGSNHLRLSHSQCNLYLKWVTVSSNPGKPHSNKLRLA